MIQMLLFYLGVAFASDLRNVSCDESKMGPIYVRPNYGTVLNFPVKPDHVLLGGSKQFGIEYIKNDIALTALSSNASTNMFVYLLGRRCGFLLKVSTTKSDHVVRVLDSAENQIKVKIHE